MILVLFAMDQVEEKMIKDKIFIQNSFLDDNGRYSYKQQPTVCKWNCGKLAEALAPLLPIEKSHSILSQFDEEFERVYMNIMRQKVKDIYDFILAI